MLLSEPGLSAQRVPIAAYLVIHSPQQEKSGIAGAGIMRSTGIAIACHYGTLRNVATGENGMHIRTIKRGIVFLVAACILPLVLSACSVANDGPWGSNSILDPAGPVAEITNNLWAVLFVVMVVIEILVAAFIIVALIRFKRRANDPDPVQITGNTRLEIAWTIAPAAILAVLLVLTLNTMITTSEPAGTTMKVTAAGHLWWWEFNYQGMGVVTGNELHIPVGQNVHFDLESDNVIHAFWVPNLSGKREVIPGHNNTLWFRADRPGTFRGECAEFCGAEHANMNFVVIAEPKEQFDAWVRGQTQPATSVMPQDANVDQQMLITQGSQTILKQACIGCHVINGLPGYNVGKVGPSLTHIGSRKFIAAGTLPNTPQNLARWLRNPQEVKPGNKMPNLNLSEDTINQLVAYLETLK